MRALEYEYVEEGGRNCLHVLSSTLVGLDWPGTRGYLITDDADVSVLKECRMVGLEISC